MSNGLSDFAFSMQMRDTIKRLVDGTLNELRPAYRYGVVSSIDPITRKCGVILNGDLAPVLIPFGALIPTEVGQIVRVDGRRDDRFISDILGPADLFRVPVPTPEVEDIHWVGQPGEPSFENSWKNYSTNWNDVGFYRDPDGVVYLSGVIGAGSTTSTMFTLPEGYRPISNCRLGVQTAGANISQLAILPDGTVRLAATGNNNNTWVNLNGLCFVADGPGNIKGKPHWEDEWQPDAKAPSTTLLWRWVSDPSAPGIWSRGDGLHIYRGYIGKTSAGVAESLRSYPYEMTPRYSHMFSPLTFNSAVNSGHGSRRVDLATDEGNSVTIQEPGAYAVSLDNIHWFDRSVEHDVIDLTSTLNPTWAVPYNTSDMKWGPPRAYVDKYGRVWLKGLINPVDGIVNGSTIMTLPEELRPFGIKQMFTARTTGGEARIDVFPSGNVQVTGSGNTYLSLDQIHFRTDM